MQWLLSQHYPLLVCASVSSVVVTCSAQAIRFSCYDSIDYDDIVVVRVLVHRAYDVSPFAFVKPQHMDTQFLTPSANHDVIMAHSTVCMHTLSYGSYTIHTPIRMQQQYTHHTNTNTQIRTRHPTQKTDASRSHTNDNVPLACRIVENPFSFSRVAAAPELFSVFQCGSGKKQSSVFFYKKYIYIISEPNQHIQLCFFFFISTRNIRPCDRKCIQLSFQSRLWSANLRHLTTKIIKKKRDLTETHFDQNPVEFVRFTSLYVQCIFPECSTAIRNKPQRNYCPEKPARRV